MFLVYRPNVERHSPLIKSVFSNHLVLLNYLNITLEIIIYEKNNYISGITIWNFYINNFY